MNDCRFCNGDVIEAEYCGDGFKTMGMMLDVLMARFGSGKKESEECKNGIQLQNGNRLAFDNSACEYATLEIEIMYCPFCGRELHPIDREEEECESGS